MNEKGNDMKGSKLKDMDLREAGDFWDEHDFFEFEDVKEDKGLQFRLSRKKYVGLDEALYKRIAHQAKKLKTTADTLILNWLKQKAASL